MFVAITNDPLPYAWGSTTGIAHVLQREPSGRPEAELWLGTHHGSPARVVGEDRELGAWLDARGHERLPFLLKVLAAAAPLSLQAHPTAEQARAGFERENALGIPVDAPERNYRDPFPKPELIVALSDRFHALCGFRPASDVHRSIGRLIELARDEERGGGAVHRLLDRMGGDESIEPVFQWLVSRGEGVAELVEEVSRIAVDSGEFPTQRLLARAAPGDPGVVVSLLLHDVVLRRGEALFLPAGNIHAYLEGVGVELMTASDNVLRGGLTVKHVDVPELLAVLDFRPVPVPYLDAEPVGPGTLVWDAGVPEFRLAQLHDGEFAITGPAIALATEGPVDLRGAVGSVRLEQGDSVFVTPDESPLRSSGGALFVATTGGGG